MAEQELDLIPLAAGEMAQTSARATSHNTFGDMPSPQMRPALLIARNTGPCVMLAAAVHASTWCFTQIWNGHRSNVSAFADEIGNHPVLLALLNGLELQSQQLSAA